MFQLPAPNHTQTPNILFDEWLPLLGMGELKILMVIMRKTFGWHKIRDQISLSQLEKITGLGRRHVSKGIKGLLEKNLIIKIVEGKNGDQKTFYELVVGEDSNINYQCPKDTPPSVLKTPTKETLTKEIISPIVPKGDIPSRKSKREEKILRATEVWTTHTQDIDLQKRCEAKGLHLQKCYDKLSAWKIGKEISGGKNDYKALVDWVIDSVEKDKKNFQDIDKNKELAQKVIQQFTLPVIENHIQLQEKGLLFAYGREYEFIEFTEFGFRDKVLTRLRKMNLVIGDI